MNDFQIQLDKLFESNGCLSVIDEEVLSRYTNAINRYNALYDDVTPLTIQTSDNNLYGIYCQLPTDDNTKGTIYDLNINLLSQFVMEEMQGYNYAMDQASKDLLSEGSGPDEIDKSNWEYVFFKDFPHDLTIEQFLDLQKNMYFDEFDDAYQAQQQKCNQISNQFNISKTKHTPKISINTIDNFKDSIDAVSSILDNCRSVAPSPKKLSDDKVHAIDYDDVVAIRQKINHMKLIIELQAYYISNYSSNVMFSSAEQQEEFNNLCENQKKLRDEAMNYFDDFSTIERLSLDNLHQEEIKKYHASTEAFLEEQHAPVSLTASASFGKPVSADTKDKSFEAKHYKKDKNHSKKGRDKVMSNNQNDSTQEVLATEDLDMTPDRMSKMREVTMLMRDKFCAKVKDMHQKNTIAFKAGLDVFNARRKSNKVADYIAFMQNEGYSVEKVVEKLNENSQATEDLEVSKDNALNNAFENDTTQKPSYNSEILNSSFALTFKDKAKRNIKDLGMMFSTMYHTRMQDRLVRKAEKLQIKANAYTDKINSLVAENFVTDYRIMKQDSKNSDAMLGDFEDSEKKLVPENNTSIVDVEVNRIDQTVNNLNDRQLNGVNNIVDVLQSYIKDIQKLNSLSPEARAEVGEQLRLAGNAISKTGREMKKDVTVMVNQEINDGNVISIADVRAKKASKKLGVDTESVDKLVPNEPTLEEFEALFETPGDSADGSLEK